MLRLPTVRKEPNGSHIGDPTKAVLLVGGLGTRLRSVVPAAPKPLASLGGESFLSLLVRQLSSQGFRRVIMCTGHLADQIENEFGNGDMLNVQVQYSREPIPLGTAGAVKFAQAHLRDVPDFIVMNGDSFVQADFHQLLRFHRTRRSLVTMAVVEVTNASRYGTVKLEGRNRISGFSEKTGKPIPGVVNAGVYVFSQAIFEHIPEGPVSLEKTLFPLLLDRGVYALKQDGIFIDIGTPEDYAHAQRLHAQLYQAASTLHRSHLH